MAVEAWGDVSMLTSFFECASVPACKMAQPVQPLFDANPWSHVVCVVLAGWERAGREGLCACSLDSVEPDTRKKSIKQSELPADKVPSGGNWGVSHDIHRF